MCNTQVFTTILIIFLLILSVSGCNLKRGCKCRLWLAFRGFDDGPSRASRRRKVRHLGSLNTQALVDNTRVEQVKMLKITTECMDALDSHGIIWIHLKRRWAFWNPSGNRFQDKIKQTRHVWSTWTHVVSQGGRERLTCETQTMETCQG